MAAEVDTEHYNGFKLSYLEPQSPVNLIRALRGPVKMNSFGEDSPKKEKLNIYLRIKSNHHALKKGPCEVLDSQTLVARVGKENNSSRNKVTETKYKFSKIFGPQTNQKALFQDVCMPSLKGFIRGDNCLLFAYGATNSGKTYTIQGTSENPGIIPRTINVLFNSIEGKVSRSFKYKPDKVIDIVWLDEKSQQEEIKFKKSILCCGLDRSQSSRLYSSKSTLTQISEDSLDVKDTTSSSVVNNEFTSAAFRDMKKSLDGAVACHGDEGMVYSVWLSYAEIYNENVFDLLETPQKGHKRKPLFVGETDQKDAFIKGLHHVCVFSGDEAFQVFQYGQHNLKMAPTNVNNVSSRSHSIFTIKLLKHLNTENSTFATVSTFSLVDLAGAERAKKTNNVGERMKESQSINTSLHVLGKCLEVIRQNQSDFVKRIIPFRESKLTRLFQRALRGQDDLTLIVNVNLDSSLHEETVNVLKFSALAKEIVFDSFVRPKPCALRSSRFSRYISETSVLEKRGNSVEVSSKMEELLALVDSLQKEVIELKHKNSRVESETREEMYKTFSDMLHQVQKNHQNSMKESENRLEEFYEWRVNRLQGYYERKLEEINVGKLKRCKTETDEVDTEEEDPTIEELQQMNKVLECKLSAVQEQTDSFKERHKELQLTNSKLVFEIASLKQELDCAKRVVKAAGSRSNGENHENDPLVAELLSQLEELRKTLKDKDEELKTSSEIIAEAKKDYLLHMEEHDDECEKRDDIEKELATKEEEIEDLKSKLELCQIKIQEQAAALEQHEDNEKYRSVCEARDEYMFSASKYEKLYKKLEKENQELRENVLDKSIDKTEVKALEAQVASLEDELKKNKIVIQASDTKIMELEKALAAVKDSSEEKESMEKELNLLQKEIKDLIQSKRDLMEKLQTKSKETESLKEELKVAEAGLTQEQNNAKDLQKYLCAENEKLTLQVASLSREVERRNIECQRLDENNQILEGMVKNQEAEMESFKTNRDSQFKIYDDMLKQKQEEVEMHKREVQRYQELFVKNPTPNKNEYLGQICKLKEEIMLLKDELKKYKAEVSGLNRELETYKMKPLKEEYLKAGRTTRRAKVQDENDPSLSNDRSLAAALPNSENESLGEKTRYRRKKLYMPPDEMGETSPVMYVKRGTRARKV